MPYSSITRGQLRQQVAARLSDSFNVFWTVDELNRLINEALQTYAAFSAFWRVRGSFDTVSPVVFYDLPTSIPAACGYTVRDIDMIPAICYHLIEPVPLGLGTPGATWVGTDMYSLDVVTKALERRRNQFQADTGMVVTNTIVPMPPAPVGRVPLPETTIDIRRLIWVGPGTGTVYDSGTYGPGPYGGAQYEYHNLWRLTEYQLTGQSQVWSTNPSVPYGYSIISSPPLTIQVGPVPANDGFLDAVVVNAGTGLDPTVGVLMGIPDDFCWVVKWGALADLLGMDGQARDVRRAQFCEQRYQLGVRLAKEAVLILQGHINGVPQIVGSIQGIDSTHPNWQSSPDVPKSVVSAGRNLVAVYPPPDNVFSLMFDVVANATLPDADGDFIQIGREMLDGLVDYAEHLAAFKMGGAEFQMTQRQADNFLSDAASYNSRLSAASLFSTPHGRQSRAQDVSQVRELTGRAINA